MAYKFRLNPESLKRKFSVYVVIAAGEKDVKLYVGKTGDNREGCNPLISRCGNHFSYNKIHSQVRNKLADHENRKYTYIFDHFDDYSEDEGKRRDSIDRINEMERWLNEKLQKSLHGLDDCQLLNIFSGGGWISQQDHERRLSYRTPEAEGKLNGIINEVINELQANKSFQPTPLKRGG
jgi:hypothetical protein